MTKEAFLEDLITMLDTKQNIDLETDLLDIEEWSSLSAMTFLEMAEEKYGVKIEPFEIAEAVLVEDLFDAIQRNNKA